MPKKDEDPQKILKDKTTKKNKGILKLNWEIFNFLENLIIFCISEDRCVPKESGICFSITPIEEDNGICLLFHIDREKDPLIKEQNSPRPDYLVFYVNPKICICTIIEMKGRTEKELSRGIKQIKALQDKLRLEISNHLPNKFREIIKFQGVLLCPFLSQPPNNEIYREANNNKFIVYPLLYNQKAELFKYISKELSIDDLTKKYKHENIKECTKSKDTDEIKLIEDLLTNRVLHQRMKVNNKNCEFKLSKDRLGVNIHLALYQDEDYLVLKLDKEGCVLGIRERNKQSKTIIETGLAKLGILNRSRNKSKIIFEEVL